MFRLRSMLPLAALGLAAMLGGCVAYPAYPGYPAYGTGMVTAMPRRSMWAGITVATTAAAGAADRPDGDCGFGHLPWPAVGRMIG